MSGLGEQIAVLDGLGALDPSDGRLGQQRARVAQYARQVRPNVLRRRHVLDASEGGNYSGGSSYAPGLPLLPSSVGLAGLRGLRAIPGVLPTRRHVIDYSGGAQYSGGSSYAPGLPLLPSSAGLAATLIEGGYGRAGLGAPLIQGGYGRAGLGQTGSAADEDLAAAAEIVEVAKRLDPSDGRIGQRRAQVDEYGRRVMPGVLARSNVIDPSEGANYSGGSDYAPGMPLMPSSIGLAGLGQSNGYGRAGLGAAANMTRPNGQKPLTREQAMARANKALKTHIAAIKQLEGEIAALLRQSGRGTDVAGRDAWVRRVTMLRKKLAYHQGLARLLAVAMSARTSAWD
jgi:hypothetical protein